MKKKKIIKLIKKLSKLQESGSSCDIPDDFQDLYERLNLSPEDGIYYPKAIKSGTGLMRTQGRYKNNFPVGAVIHSTDGRPNNGKESAESGLKEGKYVYFVIGRNGDIYQYFSLENWGSHAGVTFHPILKKNLSEQLVGIEIVSAGKLKKIDDNRFRPWYNEKRQNPQDDFTKDEVNYRNAIGKPSEFGYQKAGYYHKFTEQQEAALLDLLRWMKNANPSVFQYHYVVGHDEVAVDQDLQTHGRKSDPGGSLSITMRQLRKKLEEEVTYWTDENYIEDFHSNLEKTGKKNRKRKKLTVELPDIQTDAGIYARLFIAETIGPANPNYNEVKSKLSMQAMRAVVENRKQKPSMFGRATGASVLEIVTASSPQQFAGFSLGSDGKLKIIKSIEKRIDEIVEKANSTPVPNKFLTFLKNVNDIASIANNTDPFSGLSEIGNTKVKKGAFGWRTEGSSEPGGNFVKIPDNLNGEIAGNRFYALKKTAF